MKQPARPQRRVRRAGRTTDDVVTVEDFARRLGIGRNQAYEVVASGKISGVFRIGRRWLIPRLALDRLLSGETGSPAPETSV
jgi:excisionase family DNA binding protein